MGGIRTRLALTLVALVAITVAAIGIGTYAFVDASLRERLLAEARQQAAFNLTVLLPGRLPATPDSASFAASGLPEAFRLRGDVQLIADFGDGNPYYDPATLQGTLAELPANIVAIVRGGRLGYAWMNVRGEPSLVVGGRQGGLADIYFVFSARPIETALVQLRLGLLVAALLAIVVTLAISRAVARGILRPVHAASVAAERIAGGDRAARVRAGGGDEFGRWGAEFNRMADSLQATIAQLEAAQGQNRRFLADVSHELRTPVTALVAAASLIEGGLEGLTPDARRAAELHVADVRRLRVLVDDLMEISRFDADGERPHLEPLDLGRLVAAIVASRLPEASVSLPATPVIVDSDARRLDRILGNLLDNARAHAPGSPVDVSITVAREGALVVIADRGPGVAGDDLPRLFDRFYKADPSRRAGGSGLGLAIAAEHATLLGGSLRARNRPGGGLVFALTVPVAGSLPARHGPVTPEREASDVSLDIPGSRP